MDTTNFFNMTKTLLTNNYDNIRHEMINDANDITNLIPSKDNIILQDYISDF